MSCNHGIDRTKWQDATDKRKGWIVTTCKKCGGWIGCRPKDDKK